MTKEEEEKFMAPTLEKYEMESSPYFSTARIWDDGIINPLDTRVVLGLGISVALNVDIPDQKYGIFRM
jgi:3-methylcrotonyl-CoA carboxylase beta subunit